MENNFKGTKGKWNFSIEYKNGIEELISIHTGLSPDEYGIDEKDPYKFDPTIAGIWSNSEESKFNARTIADAGNIRQQINCDLPELLERFKKMEAALIAIKKCANDHSNDSWMNQNDYVFHTANELLSQKTVIDGH